MDQYVQHNTKTGEGMDENQMAEAEGKIADVVKADAEKVAKTADETADEWIKKTGQKTAAETEKIKE